MNAEIYRYELASLEKVQKSIQLSANHADQKAFQKASKHYSRIKVLPCYPPNQIVLKRQNQKDLLTRKSGSKDLKDAAVNTNRGFSPFQAQGAETKDATINGYPVTKESIKMITDKMQKYLKLCFNSFEDQHLEYFTHNQFMHMPNYDHAGPNTVIKSSELFIKHQNDIQAQLQNIQADKPSGIGRLFRFLKDADRTYAGLRLDKSGTTVKIVHYGTDEYPALRTEEEKSMEPALSDAFLRLESQQKVEFFRMSRVRTAGPRFSSYLCPLILFCETFYVSKKNCCD